MVFPVQRTLLEETEVQRLLYSAGGLLKVLGWIGPHGQFYRSESKKFNEIVGLATHICKVAPNLFREGLVCLDCSCGKSYISFFLNHILREVYGVKATFYGIDIAYGLIEKCKSIANLIGYNNMHFSCCRTWEFQPRQDVDIVLALHACDTATDEAIAKGIQLKAKYIIVVPCCQNQIKGQISYSQPLKRLTEFGLLRYRFADLLTDALRAQALRGAGYHVEMQEIVPPTVTPKNLVLIARKTRSGKKGMAGYIELSKLLGVRSPIEKFLPELFEEINING